MLLFFRSTTAVASLLGALALGAVVTFAFARLGVGHLNLATAFLAPIVVGNGINFGIILLARYFEERRKTVDPVAALGAAVQGSLGGTVAAALTASVSYASLLVTDFRGFRHFGLIGGVGILLCWARHLPGAAGGARGPRGARPRGRALAGAVRQGPRAPDSSPPAGHRVHRAGRPGRVGHRRVAVRGEPAVRERLQEPALHRPGDDGDAALERQHRPRVRPRHLGWNRHRAADAGARARGGGDDAGRRSRQARRRAPVLPGVDPGRPGAARSGRQARPARRRPQAAHQADAGGDERRRTGDRARADAADAHRADRGRRCSVGAVLAVRRAGR